MPIHFSLVVLLRGCGEVGVWRHTHTHTLTRFQSSSSSSFSSSYSSSSALLWPLVLCAIEFSFPSRTTLSRTFLHATPHKNALPDDPHATLPSLPSNALTVTHKRTHTLAAFPLPVFPASFPSFPPICPALFYGVMLFSKSANTHAHAFAPPLTLGRAGSLLPCSSTHYYCCCCCCRVASAPSSSLTTKRPCRGGGDGGAGLSSYLPSSSSSLSWSTRDQLDRTASRPVTLRRVELFWRAIFFPALPVFLHQPTSHLCVFFFSLPFF